MWLMRPRGIVRVELLRYDLNVLEAQRVQDMPLVVSRVLREDSTYALSTRALSIPLSKIVYGELCSAVCTILDFRSPEQARQGLLHLNTLADCASKLSLGGKLWNPHCWTLSPLSVIPWRRGCASLAASTQRSSGPMHEE